MENSKLISLLRTFSTREWKSFREFAASPYFNRNAEILSLCDFLNTRFPKFEALGRSEIWQNLSPGKNRDDKQLNHLLSACLKLAEAFVAIEKFQKDDFLPPFLALQSLSERHLDKNYRFLFEKTADALTGLPERGARHFFRKYLLEDLEREHFTRQGRREFNENLQRAADNLDRFFLTEKLKYTCAMLNSQHIVANSYSFHFVEEVRQFVENNALPADAPAIQVYYRVFRLMTRERADEDFEVLKKLLDENAARFDRPEMAELYQYALNYCIRQMRQTPGVFTEEALELYQKGINSGILMADGKLSPWHFKNVIKLSLQLRRYDWTENFILEKTPLLDEEFKTDALHYNLAELYFYTNRYDKALEHLNKVEFRDVHYNLGSKKMLAKIYFETDADNALDSLLHAFKTFLRRNKIISDDVRKTYLNFILLLEKVQRATPSGRGPLREKIERTNPLTEKTWLLSQLL